MQLLAAGPRPPVRGRLLNMDSHCRLSSNRRTFAVFSNCFYQCFALYAT